MDATLSLTIDGEYLAYCAMKSALEDIVAMRDKSPWEADVDDAVDIAKAALECEARLGSGS
jgi:hypothetical protein